MKIISQLAKHSKKDDDFGRNDDDWDVYKVIRKDTGDSDSEAEQERLAEYEAALKENAPEFVLDPDQELAVSQDSPEWYQLHLATERIRIPEILFQPSIIGHDQAGISETIEFILGKYPANVQKDLAANVFVTGSLAKLPGLRERLVCDLRKMRPAGDHIGVTVARDPAGDAWRGGRDFARKNAENGECFVTRQEFLENGAEFLKEHRLSNRYFRTPEDPS